MKLKSRVNRRVSLRIANWFPVYAIIKVNEELLTCLLTAGDEIEKHALTLSELFYFSKSALVLATKVLAARLGRCVCGC